MTCRYCGKENGADAKFCQGCGKELSYISGTAQIQSGKKNFIRRNIGIICIGVIALACMIGMIISSLSKSSLSKSALQQNEINDCLGMAMTSFQSKYNMSENGMNSVLGDNVLIVANDDGKIISVDFRGKSSFAVYGITYGMSEKEVIEKIPEYYSEHDSKNHFEYYRSHDTGKIMAFRFAGNKLVNFTYKQENTQAQSSVTEKPLSKLPTEVSSLLEKEIAEVKEQYDLDADISIIIEKDNLMMCDGDEDGKIDAIYISEGAGEFVLLGMNCNNYFSETYIPSNYSLIGAYEGVATENFVTDSKKIYTNNVYISDDGHRYLEIWYDKDKKIKDIKLSTTSGEDGLSHDNSESNLDYSTDNNNYNYYDSSYYNYNDDYDDYDDDDYDDSYEDEYILPYSDTEKLKKSDLKGLSATELRLARNEIYARHGRRFQDSSLQEYFDSQDWYYGYIEPEDFVDSEELSDLERKNAKFIKEYEEGK